MRRFLSLALAIALPTLPACGGRHAGSDGGGDIDPDCPQCFRSALYPENWDPNFTDAEGRFLHDFSYAGYRAGEADIPDVTGPIFDVAAAGADPTGAADSTSAIQAAIDEAARAGGGVVFFPAGLYRCDSPLMVSASRIVLRGEGAGRSRMFFARDQGPSYSSQLRFAGVEDAGSMLLLARDAESRAFEIWLADAADLSPGDEVDLGQVVSEAWIAEHGMTGTWTVSANQWRPFFRRTVVSVEPGSPARVRLDAPLRHPLLVRDGAGLQRIRGWLSEVGIEDLAFSNAVSNEAARAYDQVHIIEFYRVKDGWIRRVHSFESPLAEGGGHVQSGGFLLHRSRRVTVRDCTLERAQNRLSGGNGYLFEIRQSNEILIADSAGIAGRHNFIQNWDFGTSGCVFLRVQSREGLAVGSFGSMMGFSEFHHSLAMANLIDSAVTGDGWGAVNRGLESSGAGHTATETVFWNLQGGSLRSMQYRWGYVIGTRGVEVVTDLSDIFGQAQGTEPEDYREGINQGEWLRPASLYEDQLVRRLER